jgi:hypothetical protein
MTVYQFNVKDTPAALIYLAVRQILYKVIMASEMALVTASSETFLGLSSLK